MPHPITRADIPTASEADSVPDCDPALAVLRALTPAQLDALVSRWLADPFHGSVCRTNGSSVQATYRFGDCAPSPLYERLVRVHQRRSALQAHHIDAFVGALCRLRAASGLLVTTGGIAPGARRLAQSLQRPRLALLSGPEWVAELAARGLAVRRGYVPAWLFDPDPPWCPTSAPARTRKPADGRRW